MSEHTVRLLEVPVDLHWRTAATSEALMREFALIAVDTAHRADIPRRLLDLVDELNQRYPTTGEAGDAALREAAARGLRAIDVTYDVPAAVAEACQQLKDLLAEADEFCRKGEQLLSLAPPADEVAYRNWFLDEFVRQIAGEAPRRWPDVATTGSAPAPVPPPDAPPQAVDRVEAVVAVSDAIDLESSPLLRSTITELREQGYERIVLDIGDVPFVDSVGLSLLISVHRRLADEGGQLVLRRPTTPVARVLQVSGLVDLLDVEA